MKISNGHLVLTSTANNLTISLRTNDYSDHHLAKNDGTMKEKHIGHFTNWGFIGTNPMLSSLNEDDRLFLCELMRLFTRNDFLDTQVNFRKYYLQSNTVFSDKALNLTEGMAFKFKANAWNVSLITHDDNGEIATQLPLGSFVYPYRLFMHILMYKLNKQYMNSDEISLIELKHHSDTLYNELKEIL